MYGLMCVHTLCACGAPRLVSDVSLDYSCFYSLGYPELDDWASLPTQLALGIPYLCLPSAEVTGLHHRHPTFT